MARKKLIGNYVKERIESLFRFDRIRRLQLLEIIQYSTLYTILCIIASIFINKLFPENNKDHSTFVIFLKISFESTVIALLVFYIRKIAKVVPFIYHSEGNFQPYLSSEYLGEVVLSLVLFNTQEKLMGEISILQERIEKYL